MASSSARPAPNSMLSPHFLELASKLTALGDEFIEEHQHIVSTLNNENKLLRIRLSRVMSRDDLESTIYSSGVHGTTTLAAVPSAWKTRTKPKALVPKGAMRGGGRIPTKIGGGESSDGLATTTIDEHPPEVAEYPESYEESGERDTEYDRISNMSPQSANFVVQASADDPSLQEMLSHNLMDPSVFASETLKNSEVRRAKFALESDRPSNRLSNTSSSGSGDVPVGFDLFPQWFNPYNQQVYLAKKPTVIEQSLTVRRQASMSPTVKPQCILMPIGRARLTWDVVWTFCLIWEIWVTPIDFVFIEDGATPDSFRFIGYVTLSYFCADIFLNFFTGYMDGDREVLDRWMIARNYLKFWFWVDLFATVPWHEILGMSGGEKGVSTSRAAKFSKALKVIKMAKLLRIMKVSRHLKTVRRVKYQRAVDKVLNANNTEISVIDKFMRRLSEQMAPLKVFVFPCQAVLSLLFLAHMHCLFYAAVQKDWSASADINVVMRRYYESLWWCFSHLTFANPDIGRDVSIDFWTLSLIMLIERIFLTFHAMSYIIFRALVLKEDDARMSLKHTDAMAYLKSHDVSVRTQVQVLFNVNETGRIHKVQRHFLDLMENEIPTELQRQVYEELWSKHLLSFGLLWQIHEWSSDFLTELAQLVTEECYASKVIIFKEGDAAIAAYRVLQGQVVISSSFQHSHIPMFTQGMWLGEKALVNNRLRRSATGFTKTVCHLMVVPSNDFQMLLERLGLLFHFQNFCSNELWKGLCGRCGNMGDHFGHECPTMQSHKPLFKLGSWRNLGAIGRSTNFMGTSNHASSGSGGNSPTKKPHLARDLKLFLIKNRVDHLAPMMEDVGIETLDDLHDNAKLEQLLSRHSTRLKVSTIQRLTPDNIDAFKQEMAERARGMLSAKMSQNHHWLFLSHYKVEAGTEAALMRSELESLICEDDGHPAKDLTSPIFLDSEDLTDLVELLKEVSRSHNLVLMLTKGVLTRPWCVIEIASAVKDSVNIIPITINKKGAEFTFPDENFYTAFREGKILGPEGTAEVQKHGFELDEASDAIRRVLKRIAVPYSPHRTAAIRKTEMQAVLRNCTVREIVEGAGPGVESISS